MMILTFPTTDHHGLLASCNLLCDGYSGNMTISVKVFKQSPSWEANTCTCVFLSLYSTAYCQWW